MRISVYITSYNQKKYLIESVESVLKQTLRPFQIIIVDDCSADGSQEVIASFASLYPDLITPVYHTHNQGVAQTRIHALEVVSGELVTYLDGDDRYLLTKLEKEGKLLRENPEAQIAFSNYYYMRADGTHTGIWADGQAPPQGDVFRQTFAREFPSRKLFRNELVDYQAWKRIGFYDPNLSLYEDYEMRMRLTKQLRVIYCNEPLSQYRLLNAGLSKSNATVYIKALDYIYKKNSHLLADLTDKERKYANKHFHEWFSKIAKRGAKDFLKRHEPIQAAKYYIKALSPVFLKL